ncbi:hypothetical protein [Promicromonospora sp. NPDC023805]|uniref:hypothetical protein n=1 Tax=Promicromonospora sp. NPDC023805 TaxID=3154696 RepID=UPI0033E5D9C5
MSDTDEKTPVVGMTASDFFETVTGYEEHAIKKAWNGIVPVKISKEDPATWMRTLVFIHYKREGRPADIAKNDALQLTIGEVGAFFLEDTKHSPAQKMHVALAAVLDAESLETAQAAARKALEGQTAAGASGEAE